MDWFHDPYTFWADYEADRHVIWCACINERGELEALREFDGGESLVHLDNFTRLYARSATYRERIRKDWSPCG